MKTLQNMECINISLFIIQSFIDNLRLSSNQMVKIKKQYKTVKVFSNLCTIKSSCFKVAHYI